MKKLIALATVALVAVAPAHANVVLYDNFDGEAGSSILDYGAFSNFDVEDGTVDYLKGYPGLSCSGGGCVDLDGSTGNAGLIVTKLGYVFSAGDVVKLSFDLSGNQRGSASDTVLWGFRTTGGAINYNNVMIDTGGGPISFGSYFVTDLNASTSPIGSGFPYTIFSMSFTAGNAGSIKAYVGNNGTDNIGPIVDNFKLEVNAGSVPEPASWAMMIGGFAIVGGAMRRRAASVRFA